MPAAALVSAPSTMHRMVPLPRFAGKDPVGWLGLAGCAGMVPVRRCYCPVFTSLQMRVTSRCTRGSFGVVV